MEGEIHAPFTHMIWYSVTHNRRVGENYPHAKYRITETGQLITRRPCPGPWQTMVLDCRQKLLDLGWSKQRVWPYLANRFKLKSGELTKWLAREGR